MTSTPTISFGPINPDVVAFYRAHGGGGCGAKEAFGHPGADHRLWESVEDREDPEKEIPPRVHLFFDPEGNCESYLINQTDHASDLITMLLHPQNDDLVAMTTIDGEDDPYYLTWRDKTLQAWQANYPDIIRQLAVIREALEEAMVQGPIALEGPLHPDLIELATREFAWIWLLYCEDDRLKIPTADMIREAEECERRCAEFDARQRYGVPAHLLAASDQAFQRLRREPTDKHVTAWEMTQGAIDDWRKQQQQLPEINAGVQDFSLLNAQSWEALRGINRPAFLFNFGGFPSRLEEDSSSQRPVVKVLSLDRMRYELARAARWTFKTKPHKPPHRCRSGCAGHADSAVADFTPHC